MEEKDSLLLQIGNYAVLTIFGLILLAHTRSLFHKESKNIFSFTILICLMVSVAGKIRSFSLRRNSQSDPEYIIHSTAERWQLTSDFWGISKETELLHVLVVLLRNTILLLHHRRLHCVFQLVNLSLSLHLNE